MDALDSLDNIVGIRHRVIKGNPKDFATLDIIMHSSVHFQLSSQSNSSTLTIFLDNETQAKKIIEIAQGVIKE